MTTYEAQRLTAHMMRKVIGDEALRLVETFGWSGTAQLQDYEEGKSMRWVIELRAPGAREDE